MLRSSVHGIDLLSFLRRETGETAHLLAALNRNLEVWWVCKPPKGKWTLATCLHFLWVWGCRYEIIFGRGSRCEGWRCSREREMIFFFFKLNVGRMAVMCYYSPLLETAVGQLSDQGWGAMWHFWLFVTKSLVFDKDSLGSAAFLTLIHWFPSLHNHPIIRHPTLLSKFEESGVWGSGLWTWVWIWMFPPTVAHGPLTELSLLDGSLTD